MELEILSEDINEEQEIRDIYLMKYISLEELEPAIKEIIECDHLGIPMCIYLSSDGGDPAVGLYIGELIERLTVPTTLILCGEVSSSAFLIGISGYNNPNVTTVAYPSTCMMWHSGTVSLPDDYPFHLVTDWYGYYSERQNRIREYIMSHSALRPEDLDAYERKELWLFVEDLYELGIIDTIL